MAIARCESCGDPTVRVRRPYSPKPYFPVGHPDSGVLCASLEGCENTALIWLNLNEENEYTPQASVFSGFSTCTAKVPD